MKKEKLVRDNMPELCETTPGWSKMTYRIAAPGELKGLLALKLIEEAKEVKDAIHFKSRAHVIEELADLRQVMEALQKYHGITFTEIKEVQIKKWIHRGGFTKGIIWNGEK